MLVICEEQDPTKILLNGIRDDERTLLQLRMKPLRKVFTEASTIDTVRARSYSLEKIRA